jgi:hypothetical protein
MNSRLATGFPGPSNLSGTWPSPPDRRRPDEGGVGAARSDPAPSAPPETVVSLTLDHRLLRRYGGRIRGAAVVVPPSGIQRPLVGR